MNVLRESEWLDDWYVVDGAPFGQPEGTAADWTQIITLLESRVSDEPAKLVGVRFRGEHALLYSPRNACDDHDAVILLAGEIPEWIAQAKLLLGQNNQVIAMAEELDRTE